MLMAARDSKLSQLQVRYTLQVRHTASRNKLHPAVADMSAIAKVVQG